MIAEHLKYSKCDLVIDFNVNNLNLYSHMQLLVSGYSIDSTSMDSFEQEPE